MNAQTPDIGKTLRAAKHAEPHWIPKTEEANALAENLTALTESTEQELDLRGRKRTKAARASLRRCIATWAACLLAHYRNIEADHYTYLSCSDESLRDTWLARRQFEAIRGVWPRIGLHEAIDPHFLADDWDGEIVRAVRFASRYRAGQRLLELAEAHGITLLNFGEHFYSDLKDFKAIRLKARKRAKNGTREAGKPMKVELKGRAKELAEEMADLNSFYALHSYGGIDTPRLQRIFNNGDDADFRWDQGGRFYPVGVNSYLSIPSEQRANITINGEPTCEIDISASHLTILYGLLQEPLDLTKDPYRVPGLDREIVKKLVVSMIGKGGPLERWPRGFRSRYVDETGKPFPKAPAKEACLLVLYEHPVLRKMEGAALDWSKLQFKEAQILLMVMKQMQNGHETPALPVHDSLIVPISLATECEDLLRRAFQNAVGIEPRLTRKPALGGGIEEGLP